MSEYPEWLEDLLRRGGIDPAEVVELHYEQRRNEQAKLMVRLGVVPEMILITISKVEIPVRKTPNR